MESIHPGTRQSVKDADRRGAMHRRATQQHNSAARRCNGRTQRAFLEALARQARHEVDLACKASLPKHL